MHVLLCVAWEAEVWLLEGMAHFPGHQPTRMLYLGIFSSCPTAIRKSSKPSTWI
jgi:hypothetical protein